MNWEYYSDTNTDNVPKLEEIDTIYDHALVYIGEVSEWVFRILTEWTAEDHDEQVKMILKVTN